MNDEDTVEPQVEANVDQEEVETDLNQPDESQVQVEQQKQVPLSALQKERKKRQEIELELQWERKQREQVPPKPAEEDNSRFESATREDVNNVQHETMRIIEEKMWIKANPEKYERINENLPQFLKQRPNLASAISTASNRYEEAYTLMEALNPREQKQLKVAVTPKKDAPNAPSGVPKAAGLNQAEDLMNMSDQEYNAWRMSKKKAR